MSGGSASIGRSEVGETAARPELIVVGRIGRAHGVRGDVAVEPRTDAPELRFAEGSRLLAQPAERGPLTVGASRWHSGRLLVHFAGIDDRTGAERLAGTLLLIDRAGLGDAGSEAWWDHELIGLAVESPTAEALGTVIDVVHAPAQDLLCLRTHDGGEVLVPFVRALVPVVDVPGGRIVVDPPAGLLELGAPPPARTEA